LTFSRHAVFPHDRIKSSIISIPALLHYRAKAAKTPAPTTAPAATTRFPALLLTVAGAEDVAEAPADEAALLALLALLLAALVTEAIELPVAELRKLPEDEDEDGAEVVAAAVVDGAAADEEEPEPEAELDEPEAASRTQIWLVTDRTFVVSDAEQPAAMQGVAAFVIASFAVPHWHA
jgi:hypothetical protein